jgi:membrane-associated phospholipid phosphatase
MKQVLHFFGRRITPGEYLGLHLTVGLLVSLVALSVFVIIAREVVGERELTAFDKNLAVHIAAHADEHPFVLQFVRFVTNLGDVPAITTLTFAGGLLLAMQRRRLLTFVWFAAAIGGGLLNLGLKEGFERQRPPIVLRDVAITETNESFPSGHSMGSVIGYGMLGYVLWLRTRRRRERVLIAVGLGILVFLIGCSRIYLRAHWFSDVCGGFAVGTVWLTICISGLEVVRRRRHHLRRRMHAAVHHHGKPHISSAGPETDKTSATRSSRDEADQAATSRRAR